VAAGAKAYEVAEPDGVMVMRRSWRSANVPSSTLTAVTIRSTSAATASGARSMASLVVGPAGDLPVLPLAVHARVPVAALRSTIFAFPTFHRGVLDALAALS
jgi:hypothetical protein